MALIRISRGIPKYNIQIGKIVDALGHNPSAILSMTDAFAPGLMQYPQMMWVPINESAKSWGYKPFFVAKKILDFWCIEMKYPLVYVACSGGVNRSVQTVFCWLLSQEGATPESVLTEFHGTFKQSPLEQYKKNIEIGSIPEDLPMFYRAMRANPNWCYETILKGIHKYERTTYADNKWVTLV